ncbi:MAG: chromate transporter [Lentimicrobiaceae bacterium]|jgi:chromate transporter|nr:chromate transporter [Lentimicrobiaceae bacterium]
MNLCFQLFLTFFKIGAFTLGGGYAMLDLVEKSVVEKKKWVEITEFWNLIAVIQSIPGVFAVNTALYIGYKLKGIKGALCAALGSVIPSVIIILLVAIFFTEYKRNEVVEQIFKGIRPCVVALILSPSLKMIKSTGFSWKMILIPIATVFLIWWCGISPVYVIIGAIIIGLLVGFVSYRFVKKEM